MTSPRDDGYILASAIGVLFAISIVAAALVGTSNEALRRITGAERSAKREAMLQSALSLVASQLIMDPRRRTLDIATAKQITVFDQAVELRIGWESSKIDVNAASLADIEARLRKSHLAEESLQTALAAIRHSRETRQPVALLTELQGDQATETCLSSMLTVFGGQTTFDPELKVEPVSIGRPVAGSRLAIDLAAAGAEADGLSAVILLTGDAVRPWQVMDWRRSSSLAGEPCNAQ